MSRSLTTAVENASEAAEIAAVVLLAKLEYDGGTSFVNTGVSTITYDGDDYLGVGDFGGMSGVNETSEVQESSVTLTLSGVDSGLISVAFNEDYQGRPATLYMGFLDGDHALIDDPVIIFKGRMDTQNISIQGGTGTISLTVISAQAGILKSIERRYNNQSQQSLYTGDLGMEFVSQAKEKPVTWGQK